MVDVDERRKLMRAECHTCHNTYAVHGAEAPHTRGEECSGFTSTPYVMDLLVRWDALRDRILMSERSKA